MVETYWSAFPRIGRKTVALSLLGISMLLPGGPAVAGHFMVAPWGSPHLSGFASIEEAAKAGCAASTKPYHGNPSLTCDGSTYTTATQPLALPPAQTGWLQIYVAFYRPDGTIAAGAPIGYVVAPPDNKNAMSCGTVGNPINPATGAKRQCEDPDIGEGDLSYVRTYLSSSMGYDNRAGARWHATFSQRLSLGIFQNWSLAIVKRADGREFSFQRTAPSVAWVGDPDINYRLETLPSGAGYRLTAPDSTVEIYDSNGVLQSVTRPDGRSVLLTYLGTSGGAQPKLLAATNDRGRSLRFSYYPDNASTGAGSIHQIVDSAGRTVTYTYGPYNSLTSITFPDGNMRRYVYNEQNLTQSISMPNALTGIVDESGGRYASYGYNSSGRAISSEHAGGVNKFLFNYSSPNSVTIVTDPFGATHVYYFQTKNGVHLATSVSPKCTTCGLGNVTGITYDANGNRLSETEASGNQTTMQVDSARNLEIQRVEAANSSTGAKRTIQTDWHPSFRSPAERRVRDANGNLKSKINWAYNARNQVLTTTITDPATSATRTSAVAYCEAADVTAGTCPLVGLLKSADGPRTDVADTTTFTYRQADDPACATAPTTCAYRKGDLWKVTNALGRTVEIPAYDGAGRPLAMIDANGVRTDYDYHPRGWITASKLRGTDNASEADDRITRIEYWPTGLVKKVTQPDGAFTSYSYDAAHRLTGIADNAGNSIAYTLNAIGDRTKEDIKDPSGTLTATLSRAYNTLGQLQTVTDAYGRNAGFTYDANGNLDLTNDALSRRTDNDYDPLNRLIRTLQDSLGINAQTTIAYDALDNLVQVNDPKGLNTTYSYNGFSDLTQLTSPDTGTTTYTYDSAGNRASQTDARGVTTTYGYDALNRVVSVGYPTSSLNASYAYDTAQAECAAGETFGVGRLTRMTDGSGNTAYCYDRFGQLVRRVQTVDGKAHTVRWTYLANGRLQKITYPDNAEVDYLHDAQGRITEIGYTRSGGTRQVVLTGATYYVFGPVNRWTYGNGRIMERGLNLNYQPGFVEVQAAGGIGLGYEFDQVGNLKRLRTADQAEPPLREYGYDGLNRLTQSKDGATTAVLESYAYDKTGNRTSKTVGAANTPYTYPATSHRLTNAGGVARSFDANGNTTAIGGTAKEFIYGDHNRMTQAKAGGVTTMQYAYNGRGERVRKWIGTSNTYSQYDEAGRWLGDYANAGAGAPLQQVIWLGDLPVGLIVGAGASQKLHYIEPDALGTPRVAVDPARGAQGTAVWTWPLTGEAFGDTAPNQDPDGDATAFVLDMRFPGQRYDAATGLNYNYFRDYEAGTGRYTQSDPIGLLGGLSLYAYVRGDPLSRFDTQGLQDATHNYVLNNGYGGERGSLGGAMVRDFVATIWDAINSVPVPSPRGPDYIRFSGGLYVAAGSVVWARNGTIYGGGGVARLYPHPMSAGFSVSLGWQNQCEMPDRELLDSFHAGPGTSLFGAYSDIGGAIGYSPGAGTSTEVGVGAGVSMSGGRMTGGVSGDISGVITRNALGWDW